MEETEMPTGVGERATERLWSEATDTSGQEGRRAEVTGAGSRRQSVTEGLSGRSCSPRGRTLAAGGAALCLLQAEAGRAGSLGNAAFRGQLTATDKSRGRQGEEAGQTHLDRHRGAGGERQQKGLRLNGQGSLNCSFLCVFF